MSGCERSCFECLEVSSGLVCVSPRRKLAALPGAGMSPAYTQEHYITILADFLQPVYTQISNKLIHTRAQYYPLAYFLQAAFDTKV